MDREKANGAGAHPRRRGRLHAAGSERSDAGRWLIPLQRSAGNGAVGQMLERSREDSKQPATLTVQRVMIAGVPHPEFVELEMLPGTGFQFVRRESRLFLYDAATQSLLWSTKDRSLNQDTATELTRVFGDLNAQSVDNLDGLIKSVAAVGRRLGWELIAGRLRLMNRSVHDVVLQRIERDHRRICAMSSVRGRLSADFARHFRSIEIPGSDPHKGGQVVAFINYRTIDDRALRVVYKPGNLAFDALLYGTGGVAAKLGKGKLPRGIAAYEILPMGDDYGYMEFIDTERPATHDDVVSVYRSVGENLALAYVFGFRDIHHENFVLRGDRVQLIDVEASTGTFTGFQRMELLSMPRALAKKIVTGLTPDQLTFLPQNAVLKHQIYRGFRERIKQMGQKPYQKFVRAEIGAMANLKTRFVPISTPELQNLAAEFFGLLGPDATADAEERFMSLTAALAREAAAKKNVSQPSDLERGLLLMLRDRDTRAALNRGDVPFWTRRGNDIFAESGPPILRGLQHPRLATADDIAAGAIERTRWVQAKEDFINGAANLFDGSFPRDMSETEAE